MSKKNLPPDTDNPFLSIDKSQFPRERDSRSCKRVTGFKKANKAFHKSSPVQDLDAESEYFFQLMNVGGVEKLSKAAKISPTDMKKSAQIMSAAASAMELPELLEEFLPDCLHAQFNECPPEELSKGVSCFMKPRCEQGKPVQTLPLLANKVVTDFAPDSGIKSGALSGLDAFGSMADKLAGIKLNVNFDSDTLESDELADAREQEEHMLREYLASALKRPTGTEKIGKSEEKTASSFGSITHNATAPQINTEDDEFSMAMREVAPLSGKGRAIAPEPDLPNSQITPSNPMQDFIDGKVEFSLEFTEEFIEGHVIGLDPAIMGKLRAGSFSYEAHLDLHGLNSAQAFDSLVAFIRKNYMGGKRTVLAIPGRGKNSPDGTGILRDKLQEWLTQEPFKRVVLAFATALPKHGGPGAIYVLLRKHKKSSGKIRWDITPNDPDLFV